MRRLQILAQRLLETPRTGFLWLFGNALLLSLIPAADRYYQRLAFSGTLRPDADSIAIPIALTTIAVLLATPVINLALLPMLMGARGAVPLFVSAAGQSVGLRIVSAYGYLAAPLIAVWAYAEFEAGAWESGLLALGLAWAAACARAMIVDATSAEVR